MLVSLVLCTLFPVFVPRVFAANCKKLWGLVVCGSEGNMFWADTQYMYHVLHDHYTFSGLDFLSVDTNRPGVNASATKNNVRNAITQWLSDHSTSNDEIFIFFSSHGGGYDKNRGFFPFNFSFTADHTVLYLISGGAHRISLEPSDENGAREILESNFVLNNTPALSTLWSQMIPYDLDEEGENHKDDYYCDFYRNGTIYMLLDLGNNGTLFTHPDWKLFYVDVDGDGNNDDLFFDIGANNTTDVLIDANADWRSDGEDLNCVGRIIGVDFNGNGNQNDWVGVDEGLQVMNNAGDGTEVYWDDELRSDLDALSSSNLYDKLVFVRCGCVEDGQGCYSGGLIDDISAPNRIIMCSSNETTESWGNSAGFSYWGKQFIDAMHGETVIWNGTGIVHTGQRIDADLNHDGHVTLNETWQYAWDNDGYREDGRETPWRDDNGNGLPTFRDGQDFLDSSDGSLSEQMILEPALITVLIGLGFDQNRLVGSPVETFEPGHYIATLYAEFASYHASNNLSWYLVNTNDWNLVFSGPEGGFGYVDPPVVHSFTPNSTFGLSFCTSEHRYFTQNGNNPDGLAHSRVYLNLDNPRQYLVGFENWYGDGSDKDYNDMVIALENVNNPPSVPLISGNSRGYVYTNYTCIANSTDPEGDNVYYLFNWGDGTNSTVGPAQSHANTTATHQWTRPGTYNVTATSRDTYGASNNQSSSPLVLNVTQNDNGCLGDASNTHASATTYSQGVPTGALYNSSPEDTQDWYKFHANSGDLIKIDMTPPSGIDFDLELYRQGDAVNSYNGSYYAAGYTEQIISTANETGWWRAKIFIYAGDGQYTFHVSVTAPGGGGGGCPYVYAWNGTSYVKDNNILPASENGNGTDVEDHYKLEQPLVPFFQGQQVSLYSLQLLEFEHEHDYVDQVNLLAVDHSQGTSIAVTPEGEILTYQNPVSPASCVDNYGNSRLGEVGRMDGNVSMQSTYFQGYAGDWLLLNFGRVTAENAKLILRDDQKCADVCINMQVPDQAGNWQTVEVLHPRDYWAVEAVNLTAYVPANGDFIVRLLWTATHRLDYVGLDTTSQEACEFHQASVFLAVHSTEGNVIRKILENDQIYTELVPGERIQLAFFLPSNQNQERAFILHTEGHYNLIT